LENILQSSERIDDLLTHNLKIIQSRQVFSFSIDAVLLAHFASIPKQGQIIDLCTGNGVIPLLISVKTKAKIYGIDIQERLIDMANRSVELNQLTDQIKLVHNDLKESTTIFGKGLFDLVTVNPPYLPIGGQDQNSNEHLAIARHEISTNLEEVLKTSHQLLKVGGRLAMVHRPFRLVEIIALFREYKIEPKRLRFVHPNSDKEANMILIEGTKGGGKELRVLPPVIVYDRQGEYSKELYQIYYGDKDE